MYLITCAKLRLISYYYMWSSNYDCFRAILLIIGCIVYQYTFMFLRWDGVDINDIIEIMMSMMLMLMTQWDGSDIGLILSWWDGSDIGIGIYHNVENDVNKILKINRWCTQLAHIYLFIFLDIL